MKRIYLPFIIIITISIFAIYFFFKIPIIQKGNEVMLSPLGKILAANSFESLKEVESSSIAVNNIDIRNDLKEEVHLLLLGLDGRKGDKNPRCDAVHLLNFNFKKNILTIISIPRGTALEGPSGKNESVYLANSCHTNGIASTIPEIEKIAGQHVDYTIKIGFSQVLGILRTLQVPTTQNLQFLRNRSYAVGDYQRSHNQAVFLKDMITKHFELLAKLPKPLRYLAYRTLDTDLDFEEANMYFELLSKTAFYKDQNNIVLETKPFASPYVKDIHLALTENKTTLTKDPDYNAYQNNLKQYMDNLISHTDTFIKNNNKDAAYKIISTPYAQKIWLQIENNSLRLKYQYDFLRLYVLTSPDRMNNSTLILDFITEMEILSNMDYLNKGKNLLTTIN